MLIPKENQANKIFIPNIEKDKGYDINGTMLGASFSKDKNGKDKKVLMKFPRHEVYNHETEVVCTNYVRFHDVD